MYLYFSIFLSHIDYCKYMEKQIHSNNIQEVNSEELVKRVGGVRDYFQVSLYDQMVGSTNK